MRCIYWLVKQWMDESRQETNGDMSARLEEGPTTKFISRPTIWNLVQWQLSLDLQCVWEGDICETIVPGEAGKE